MTKIGILGGGQLGKMFIQEGLNYNLTFHVLDPDPNCSCSAICHSFTQGDFRDEAAVLEFGKDLDLITIEIEHVNTLALKKLRDSGVSVFPQPEVIELIQDKGLQKQFYSENKIPTIDYRLINSKAELEKNADFLPVMQKLRKGGYDGKGVQPLRSATDFDKAFDAPSVLEKLEEPEMEISVLVARNVKGEKSVFPPVELVFNPEANLVELLFSPARIPAELTDKATQIATLVADKINIAGLLAVEMFVIKGEIYVNEIAPRPHNSGHQTIEGNYTSQYHQHLRAIMDWPLGSVENKGYSAMINLLGDKGHEGTAKIQGLEGILSTPGAYLHWYGKSDTRPFRKMGHVTVNGTDADKVLSTARELLSKVKIISS